LSLLLLLTNGEVDLTEGDLALKASHHAQDRRDQDEEHLEHCSREGEVRGVEGAASTIE
jgi:hypothetical protein